MVENDNEREATELGTPASSDHAHDSDHNDGSDGPVVDLTQRRQSAQNQHPLKKFWKRQIAVTVLHEDCRDHFGR